MEREWLDELPATDPGARGSRRDLKRLNSWMGHARIVERELRPLAKSEGAVRVAELGAGDGDFLLRVARRLGGPWRGCAATLVDRQKLVTEETAGGFHELGWRIETRKEDVFDWCRDETAGHFDVVTVNLFLHHFDSEELQKLFRAIEQRSAFFVAVEPRRSLLSLGFSHLLGFIGCNAVTRHDAPASVRAGFSGRELSRLWNGNGDCWILREEPVGPFSHLFMARRRSANHSPLSR